MPMQWILFLTYIFIRYFQLTAAAVKDYNRGRSYLIDLARRQDVPVFNDLKQAVECTIEKVKQCTRGPTTA